MREILFYLALVLTISFDKIKINPTSDFYEFYYNYKYPLTLFFYQYIHFETDLIKLYFDSTIVFLSDRTVYTLYIQTQIFRILCSSFLIFWYWYYYALTRSSCIAILCTARKYSHWVKTLSNNLLYLLCFCLIFECICSTNRNLLKSLIL